MSSASRLRWVVNLSLSETQADGGSFSMQFRDHHGREREGAKLYTGS